MTAKPTLCALRSSIDFRTRRRCNNLPLWSLGQLGAFPAGSYVNTESMKLAADSSRLSAVFDVADVIIHTGIHGTNVPTTQLNSWSLSTFVFILVVWSNICSSLVTVVNYYYS